MRRLVLLAPALALLAGCGVTTVAGTATPSKPSASASGGAQLPPDPEPASTASCPYLVDVLAVRLGDRPARRRGADLGRPAASGVLLLPPDGKVQLSVQVYVGQPDIATALVTRR